MVITYNKHIIIYIQCISFIIIYYICRRRPSLDLHNIQPQLVKSTLGWVRGQPKNTDNNYYDHRVGPSHCRSLPIHIRQRRYYFR